MQIGKELFVALVIILSITACGSNNTDGIAAQSCTTMYSRESGYTFDEQSMKGVVVSGSTITGPHDTMNDITAALNQLKSLCLADGGRNCDPDSFRVTPQAAVCLAKASGLADGISPWERSLDYNYGYKTIIWSIRNTTWSSQEIYNKRGEYVMTSTTDGALLESGGWEAIE